MHDGRELELNVVALPSEQSEDPRIALLRLERRVERERRARLEAEAIAEGGTRALHEKQRQLKLLQTIATAANESSSIADTLRFALKEICAFAGWSLGHVYEVSRGDHELLPTAIWHAADEAMAGVFRDATLLTPLPRGVGLPGRVLATGAPAWLTDVTDATNFPRAQVAAASGLRAGFAFPVMVGREVAAVMEFFTSETREPDNALLALMAQIGTQLGRVIERKRAEERLVHDASHDPLTGLPNRALLLDRLNYAIARRRRDEDFQFALLFVDLDRFKLVNDSLGHAAGDVLLIEVGRRLQAALRQEDLAARPVAGAASSPHTLARLGGDEFIVLIEELAHPSDAVRIGERLIETLARPITVDGQEVYATASVGVATSTAEHAAAEDILRDADLAMYRAKSSGRGRIEIYDHGLHEVAISRLKLESDIRRAVREHEFTLHYQPIVALESREVVGFEALVRWQRSPQELVYPDRFIAVAEETGLIVFIGLWVLREACRTAARWQRAFPRPQPLTMSINLSPRQFQQPDLVEQVRAIVTEAGVAPETVHLEVTEGVTIDDPERTIRIIEELRAFGVGVGIDDFGTGYSSLSYIHRLPLDVLKIDRSFVLGMDASGEGRQIVRTIMDLAQNLDIDVIAEGAEQASHVDQLQAMGCHFGQGYFFSRPVEAAAAEALLAQGPFK
ncbi:MAG TPA: GGDEF domain-containing protein [Hyphomicrobiales bacterium]|nr:GGDEF domain-containing protein [Hyphomicrobiales bacterium]